MNYTDNLEELFISSHLSLLKGLDEVMWWCLMVIIKDIDIMRGWTDDTSGGILI